MPFERYKSEYFFGPTSYVSANHSKEFEDAFWGPWNFSHFEFNKEHLVERSFISIWDGTYDSWDESNAYVVNSYSYNEVGLVTKREFQDLSAIQAGRLQSYNAYNYNEDNLLTSVSVYIWNADQDSLLHRREVEYNYNSLNNLEEIISFSYDLNDGWELDDSTYFQYNELNQLTNEKQYYTVGPDQIMTIRDEHFYTYNEEGQLIKDLHFTRFDEESNTWKDADITLNFYYNYGSLAQSLTLDSVPNSFENRLYYESNYSHFQNMPSDRVLIFQPLNKTTPTFNIHDEKYVQKEVTHYSGGGNSTQILDYKAVFYYSPLETSSTEIEIDGEMKLFPNPTSDFITLTLPNASAQIQVEICNIHGQLVKSDELFSGEKIDISFLDKGVYFYSAKVNEIVYGGKFMKY
ncbi:MAG: T9SS type A sorting domain-containing protein [Saprospiraceae bacterium]|nr:T9SS type A sorting domain-containing protein [Bacteroidia bacterium]NNE16264.1 T9SS type A sorting domain-containing protein [Saprospiraceae bacterium]